MTVANARMNFAIRCRMTRTIQLNYKGDPKCKKNGWTCVGCGDQDSQEHVVTCGAYAKLRDDLDLGKDTDLVKYFKKVIAMREGVLVGL